MVNYLIDFRKFKAVFACAAALCIALASIPIANSVMTAAQVSGIRFPVLMYHHVLDSRKKLNKYTISSAEFESDLQYIQKCGYTTVTVQDLINYCEKGTKLPDKPIMITFDDGYESVYVNAYPLLKKYKMKAVINVIGKYADLYSDCDDHNINYSHITWDQLREISQSGVFEVQNHTYDLHKNGGRKGIGKMSGESEQHYHDTIANDIIKMQQRTKEMLGITPSAFAYPFGNISSSALPVIKETGIKAVFCCWEKFNYLTGDPEQLYHINRFNRPHGKSTADFFAAVEKQ